MVGRCWKCGGKKRKVTRHHVYGKDGLCGLRHDSDLPLVVFLTLLGIAWDDIDLLFWSDHIVPLCRDCHDKFHLLFTRLMMKCDDMESEVPLREFLEVKDHVR